MPDLSATAHAADQSSSRGKRIRATTPPTTFAQDAGIMPKRAHGSWFYVDDFGADGGSW